MFVLRVEDAKLVEVLDSLIIGGARGNDFHFTPRNTMVRGLMSILISQED